MFRAGGDAWVQPAAAGEQQPGTLGAGAGPLCARAPHRPPRGGEAPQLCWAGCLVCPVMPSLHDLASADD